MNVHTYNDSLDTSMMTSTVEVDAQYENVNLKQYDDDASQIVYVPITQRNHGVYRHQPYHYRYLKNNESEPMKSTMNNNSTFCVHKSTNSSLRMDRIFVDPINMIPMLNNQGVEALEQGEYDLALKYFRRCLNSLRDNLDYHYHSSLLAMNMKNTKEPPSLSASFNDEYDEGMDMDLTPITMEGLVLELIDTVNKSAMVTLYNLGILLMKLKIYEEALSFFNGALFLRRSEGNSSPLNIIALLRNIGCIHYYGKRDPEKAMVAFDEIIRYRHTLADEDEIASVFNCIGVLHFHSSPKKNQNNTSLAHEYFNQAVNIRTELLYDDSGDDDDIVCDDKSIATYLNNIGRCMYMNEEYEEALDVYVNALTIRRTVLGDHALDVAATAYNMGQTYHQMGDKYFDKALLYYQDFVNVAVPILGDAHRDVGQTYKSIAQIYQSRRKYDHAISSFETALQAVQVSFGMNHPEIASILNKMGNVFYELGEFGRALELYMDGLSIERNVLHQLHPNIIVTLTNIGHIAKQIKKYDLSLKYYYEALEIQKKSLCDDGSSSHPNIAITLSNIALIYYEQRTYAKSLDVYQEALVVRRGLYGDSHLEVASSLNSVGLVLFKLGFHELSLRSFCECLKTRREILGPDHRDIAVILYNIATIHMERNDEESAIDCYRETLRIETKQIGPNHPDLVLTLQHIGQLYHQRAEYDSALHYLKDVLRIQQMHHSNTPSLSSSPSSSSSVSPIIQTLINISEVHMENSNLSDMMSCMTEASRIVLRTGSGDTNEVIPLPVLPTRSLHYDFANSTNSAAAA